MIIHAKGYVLRSFETRDVTEFYRITHNDVTIQKFLPAVYPRDIMEAYETVETYSEGDCVNDFYLVIEDGNTVVGAIIAVRTIGKVLDTSAFISKPYRGKGIMTIVLNAFKHWLRCNTDYEALSLVINKENFPSMHQAQKCGSILVREDEENRVFKIFL